MGGFAPRTTEAAGGAGIWLAVETATPIGSVAVWKDGPAVEQTMRIQGAHSELVLPAVDHALAAVGASAEDVSAIIIGAGPGSFTGVRVAASLAKGWAMARGTPMFAYSSLLALAAGSGQGGSVCPMFDARRGEVYAACYDVGRRPPAELLPPAAWRPEKLLEELARRGLRPALTGDGALVHRAAIADAWPEALILPEHLAAPRAASLLWLRQVAPELGRVRQPDTWEPLYVRAWRVPEGRGPA